jgi:hypothetical protein
VAVIITAAKIPEIIHAKEIFTLPVLIPEDDIIHRDK